MDLLRVLIAKIRNLNWEAISVTAIVYLQYQFSIRFASHDAGNYYRNFLASFVSALGSMAFAFLWSS